MIRFLDMDDLLETHAQQIANYGGSEGLRDSNLLASAIAQPEASFAGNFLHADLYEMAAAYLFHIVSDHPFIDGNKRVGLEAALIFLEINGIDLVAADHELVDVTLATATGQISKDAIAEFFRTHARQQV
jgi:death-on-curing protein